MGLLLSLKSLAVCQKCSTFAAVSLTGTIRNICAKEHRVPQLAGISAFQKVSETTIEDTAGGHSLFLKTII